LLDEREAERSRSSETAETPHNDAHAPEGTPSHAQQAGAENSSDCGDALRIDPAGQGTRRPTPGEPGRPGLLVKGINPEKDMIGETSKGIDPPHTPEGTPTHAPEGTPTHAQQVGAETAGLSLTGLSTEDIRMFFIWKGRRRPKRVRKE